MAKFQVKGVNDDRSECECCGKTGLKRVVWIENTETSEIKAFGTTCALSPVKGFDCTEEIKKEVARATRKASEETQAIYGMAHKLYRKAGGSYAGTLKAGLTATDLNLMAQCVTQATEMRKQYQAAFSR